MSSYLDGFKDVFYALFSKTKHSLIFELDYSQFHKSAPNDAHDMKNINLKFCSSTPHAHDVVIT